MEQLVVTENENIEHYGALKIQGFSVISQLKITNLKLKISFLK